MLPTICLMDHKIRAWTNILWHSEICTKLTQNFMHIWWHWNEFSELSNHLQDLNNLKHQIELLVLKFFQWKLLHLNPKLPYCNFHKHWAMLPWPWSQWILKALRQNHHHINSQLFTDVSKLSLKAFHCRM